MPFHLALLITLTPIIPGSHEIIFFVAPKSRADGSRFARITFYACGRFSDRRGLDLRWTIFLESKKQDAYKQYSYDDV